MRPKKVILTVGSNPFPQEVQAFTLMVRGYTVVEAHPETTAMIGGVKGIDLVLLDLDIGLVAGFDLARSMKRLAPDVPVLLLSRRWERCPPGSVADGFIGADSSPIELLEMVRILCMRKRGPKKAGSVRERAKAVSA